MQEALERFGGAKDSSLRAGPVRYGQTPCLGYSGLSWIRPKGRNMRTFLLMTGAAVFVLGAPSFAAAQTLPPVGGNLTNNSQGCENGRRTNAVSPSRPNNGFGNCGRDLIPGGSPGTPGGSQDQTR